VAIALGGPEQGCFGVPTGVGFEERVEVVEEFGVAIGEARPSGSWPAGALGGRFGPGMVEFGEAGSNGGAREPGRLGDGGGAPSAEGVGFGGGPASRDALVHEGGESLILRSQYGYSFFGDHVPHFVQ